METGFFRWLWRFNAVIIALGATWGLVVLGVAFVELASGLRLDGGARDPLAAPVSEPAADTSLELGALQPVGDTGLLRGHLMSLRSYDYGFSSGGAQSETFNILYVDPAQGSQRWLFPPGRRLILRATDIERPAAAADAPAQIVATLMFVVDTDSSGDGRLSGADGGALMIAGADGGNLRVLSEGVREVVQTGALSSMEEFVVLDTAEGRMLLRLDLAKGGIIGQMKLDLAGGGQ